MSATEQPAKAPQASQKQQKRANRGGNEVDRRQLKLVHLKTIERVFKWPVVETTWKQGTQVYGKLKGSNVVINWTCVLAENTCTKIISISRPLVQTLNTPITFVDSTLDRGLKGLEQRAPIVKENPSVILEQTKVCVKGVVQPTIDCATSIVVYSKGKANTVLSTKYGSKLVVEVDKVMQGVDKLIDRYIPRRGDEASKSAVPLADDPLLHVIETFGIVVSKIGRRVLITLHA